VSLSINSADLEVENAARILDAIVTEVELGQRGYTLESGHRGNSVVLQREILQPRQCIEPGIVDAVDEVAGEGKTLQLKPVASSFYASDTVVVQR